MTSHAKEAAERILGRPIVYDNAGSSAEIKMQLACQSRRNESAAEIIQSAIDAATRELREEVERLRKQLDIANKKNAHSLANNLCPDHRDKQQGKACLACEVERLKAIATKITG